MFGIFYVRLWGYTNKLLISLVWIWLVYAYCQAKQTRKCKVHPPCTTSNTTTTQASKLKCYRNRTTKTYTPFHWNSWGTGDIITHRSLTLPTVFNIVNQGFQRFIRIAWCIYQNLRKIVRWLSFIHRFHSKLTWLAGKSPCQWVCFIRMIHSFMQFLRPVSLECNSSHPGKNMVVEHLRSDQNPTATFHEILVG